ncbi:MAG TPA: hypothetical protein VEZ90_07470 [Blastocatellia bacterium]|nr:hypothetical protein [Blastocatellia bacterium]
MNRINWAAESSVWGSPRPAFQTTGPIRLLLVVTVLASLAIARPGQLQEPPLPVDPTPLKQLLSNGELAELSNVHKTKDTTELLLKISDLHLAQADKTLESGDTNAAERELDIHNKAAKAACDVAFHDPKEKRKLGKIVEQRLYAQLRFLESLQRRFPMDLVAFADAAMKQTKELRDHALNETLAIGTVIDETPEKNKEKQPPLSPEKLDRQFLANGPAPLNATPARAQVAGDYMTENEEDKVKEAQEIDQRTKVFLKIADRRLDAITHPAGAAPVEQNVEQKKAKKKKKDDEEEKGWGAVPNVSKAELLTHYSKAISELEDKLDDANRRSPRRGALKSALGILRDGTERQLTVLHSLEPQLQADEEKRALREAIATAEEAHNGAVQGLKSR